MNRIVSRRVSGRRDPLLEAGAHSGARLLPGVTLVAAAGLAAALCVTGARAGEREMLRPASGTNSIELRSSRHDGDALKELIMERGKSVSVRTEYRVKRVSVGNPEVADVIVLSPRDLQLIARNIGTTNALVWDTENRVQAVIDVHVGSSYSYISSELRRVLENEDITIENAGDSVILRGQVSTALAMEQALTVARAFLPADGRDRIINLLEVGGGHQVMLEVVIAEMSRSLNRSLGTNFHTVTGSDGATFEFFNFLGNLTSLESREFAFDLSSFELTSLETIIDLSQAVTLGGAGFGVGTGIYEIFFDLLERNGLGKVLAEPTLVARNGETASFLVGGETPIPVAQGGAFGSITIEFKEFGVGLAFTPTVLAPDRIHLQVMPEVSEPNFTFGTTLNGTVIPSFNTRRASTAVELGDGQSFAIAGLLRDDVTELINRYPLIGEVPVFGALFRSSSFQKRETELVMIVTPRIVKPLGPGPHPLPTDHFIEPNDFEFYLLGRLEAGAEPEPALDPRAAQGQLEGSLPGGMIGGAGHRVRAAPEQETR